MSIEFTIDNHSIFCTTGGQSFDASKRTVILVHGAGMDHSYWSLQSRWFAWHGWSVLVPDLPGHRGSEGEPLSTIENMANWMRQLMDAAGLKKTTLVGHSMGALVVLQTAADLGHRVEHIGLLGVADKMPVHPDLLEAAKKNDPLAYDLVTSWGHGQGSHFGRNQQPGIWMLGGARQLMARNKPDVLFNDLNACNEWKGGINTTKKVKCRTLVIMGDNDLMTPLKRGQVVADAIENSTSVILKDCGHMMMQEQPDQTLDALIDEFQS